MVQRTINYVTLEDKRLTDVKTDHEPVGVVNPNGRVGKSTHDRTLAFPHVLKEARHSFVLSTLSGGSLYAMGQFCNDNCIALFEAQTAGSLKGTNWFCVAPANQAACGTLWLKSSIFSNPKTQSKCCLMSMHSNHRRG